MSGKQISEYPGKALHHKQKLYDCMYKSGSQKLKGMYFTWNECSSKGGT